MKKSSRALSYLTSGVDAAGKEKTLAKMERAMKTNDRRLLSTMDAFATLFDGKFPRMKHPVLVMKTEEPGSKQLLAFQHDRIESVCEDMINHLINDIVVMGAVPLAVQDAVICGKLDAKILQRIIRSVASACRAQGCTLTGGETSEQPGVIPDGTYILASNIVGVVEKADIIDGSRIKPGNVILAVASNGLHTNGYSLVRRLIKEQPGLLTKKIAGQSFIDTVLKPHTCYYHAVKGLFGKKDIHGMAHITGGGIEGNMERILPKNVDAVIHRDVIRVLPIFTVIREAGNVLESEMMRTYNMGVGLTLVVEKKNADRILQHIRSRGHECYPIGEIEKGRGRVGFRGNLQW